MDASSNEAHESAKELNSAFLEGPRAFKKQLAKISDQQYVSLLTLLDEHSMTLKRCRLDESNLKTSRLKI